LNYYQYVDYYLCPSVFLYEKFKSFNFFPEKLVQLYHGYQYEEVEAVNSPAVMDEKYIVFVGRLEKIKGAHTLLQAMMDQPEIHLKLVGNGTQEEELKAFAANNQMYNITFMGKQSKKQTLEIIKGSEFLICPSEWYEVLGFTVVEAMAMGKPVIGAAIGAIPEMVIDGQTGILFAQGNARDLSQKIKALYHDQEAISTMGKRAKTHIHQLINTENHYTGLQKLVPSL
jgi:glycosyltransferase involved in cell wall biosynthesis